MNHDSRLLEHDEDGADLGTLFATTMADLDTNTSVMAQDALRHGRPRRRRRVLASVAAGTVSVVLLGGLGAYGISTISAAPGQPVVPAAPVTEPASPSPIPTPSPSGRSAKVEPQPDQLTSRVAALYLTRLAPSGTVSEYRGQESPDALYVESQIDRGEGKVGLQINVQGNFLGAPGKASRKEIASFYRCQAGYASCDVVRDRDGSILMTYTEALPGGQSGKARAVTADFLRSDGTRVVVLTGNVSDTKYGGKPRRGVTLAEARAIVVDPVWDPTQPPSAEDVAEASRVIKPWKLIPG